MTEFTTRRPTGLPAWPIALIAGVEKSGKTWRAVEASASKMIHRTFWVGVGEDDPDEYGILPGADFEIVAHDGTYRGILTALTQAAAQESPEGQPNLIVLDSATRLWALLVDSIQETANERWKRKNQGKELPDDGIRPSMDLWNLAKDRWGHILDALRNHQGPSLITSRLELVTVMDDSGNPTKEKWWKVGAEKNLAYEVGLIIQMRASYPESDTHLTGVKSARFNHPTDAKGKPVGVPLADDWTVEGLWNQLGLAEAVGARTHAHTKVQGEDATRDALLEQVLEAANAAGVDPRQIVDDWAHTHDGQHIRETTDMGGLELLRDDLLVQAQNPPQEAPEAEQGDTGPEPHTEESTPVDQPVEEPPADAGGLDPTQSELVTKLVARLQDPDILKPELLGMYQAARNARILDVKVGDDALGGILMERGKAAKTT